MAINVNVTGDGDSDELQVNVNGPIRVNVARCEAAADEAEAAGTDSIAAINAANASALGAIGTANTTAIAAIGQAQSDALDAINDAEAAALGAAVDTIADLTGIAPASRFNGQMVYVRAWSAETGAGGGWFVFDEASEAGTDGGTVFCPDDLAVAATELNITYNQVSGASTYALPHQDLIWGTVTAGFADGLHPYGPTMGSEWFHGHQMAARHTVSGAVNANHRLNHKTGVIHNFANAGFVNLAISNVATNATESSRTFPLNYSYASGAGRWLRVMGDHVTPAMFGGKPNASRFDNANAICWALNYLNGQDSIKTLKYDGNYYVYGFRGEVFSGITQVGLGQETPCITYFGEDPDDTDQGGVIDLLQEDYYSEAWKAAENWNPYRLLYMHFPGQVPFDNATGYVLRDMCVDGNISNNMYFLTSANTDGGGWDTTAVSGHVSGLLRETPCYTGFSSSNYANRYLSDEPNSLIENCHFHDTGGSCVLDIGGQTVYDNVKVGNALSARPFYGMPGRGSNIKVYGYTRTSLVRTYGGTFNNITVTDLAPNPWPENAEEGPLVLGSQGLSRTFEGLTTYGRYTGGLSVINNINIDVSGLTPTPDPNSQPIFGWAGEETIRNGFRIKGNLAGLIMAERTNGDNGSEAQATAGPIFQNGVIWNRSLHGVKIISDGVGMAKSGLVENISIQDTLAHANVFNPAYTHDLTQSNWSKSGVTISADADTDEIGLAILDRVIEDSSTGLHRVNRVFTTVNGTSYLWQCDFWKGSGGADAWIGVDGIGNVFLDLDTGEIAAQDASVASAGAEAGILDLGSGGYRAWIKYTDSGGYPSRAHWVGLTRNAAGSSLSYAGDGASYCAMGNLALRSFLYFTEALPGPNVVIGNAADPGGQGLTYRPVSSTVAGIGFVFRMDDQPPGDFVGRQEWTIRNVSDDTYKQKLATFNGGDTANNVPTIVHFDGCKFPNLQSNKWFSTSGTGNLSNAVNLTIRMTNCLVPTYDPAGSANYGDNTAWIADKTGVTMRGCYTAGGKKSEYDGIQTVTVVGSSPGAGEVLDTTVNSDGYIDFPLSLMWRPITYGAVPISEDAVTRGVTSVAVQINSSNETAPYLRVGVGSVTAGDVLSYRLSGQVTL